MSNLLYMDESNGNGIYAAKSVSSLTDNGIEVACTDNGVIITAAPATATTTHATMASTNNISIMNSSAAAAAAAAAVASTLPTSVSSEDLSQSLSEYTDADESISAPTEFLAEFLSAVMLKDYKKALKYCKLILQYEPNNATAKEFYPLILDKLRVAASSDSDENYNKSSSPELALDGSAGESEEAGSDEAQLGYEEPNSQQDSQAMSSNSSCNNCSEEPLSLSECEDDIDNVEEDDEEDDDDDDVEEEDDDDIDDVMSSSGDDLPIDEQQDVANVDGLAAQSLHGSGSSRNSSSGGGGRSDNTTHSYSSLLLEEEDDIVPVSLQFCHKEPTAAELDVSNGNKVPSASCSDSESPTEPLTQRLAAILRSKCGVSANSSNNEHY